MNEALGWFLRTMREDARYSQEALARDAGCNVRSIQRAEAGEPVSIETVKAIGAVLGFDGERAMTIRMPSKEEARAAAEAAHARGVGVQLERITTSAAWNVLGRVQCRFFHCRGDDDALQDRAADLETHVQECMDLWSDLDPSARRDATKELARLVGEIERAGGVVSYGIRVARLKVGKGEPLEIGVLVLSVWPKGAEKVGAIVPRLAAEIVDPLPG